MTKHEIDNYFTYHPPTKEQIGRYSTIRDFGKDFVKVIFVECPESIEKNIAIEKIREAVMWANAAIACNDQLIKEIIPGSVELKDYPRED